MMSDSLHDNSADVSSLKQEERKDDSSKDGVIIADDVSSSLSSSTSSSNVSNSLNTPTEASKRVGCSFKCMCDALMQNYWRYCASGFIQNFSQYYYWILIPLVAQDLGATAFEFGMIQCLGSLVYALASLGIGMFLVERIRSGIFARIAFVLFLIACGFALAAKQVWLLFIAVFISGTGNACYWSPIQNAVGREAGAKKDSATARFSVFHALGKSIGYILGGLLKGSMGATVSFIADMVFSGTQIFFVPWGISPSSQKKYDTIDQNHQDNDHTNSSSVLHSVDDITPSATPEVIVSTPHVMELDSSQPPQEHQQPPETPSPLPLPSSSLSPSVQPSRSPSPSPSLPLGHAHDDLSLTSPEARNFARNTVFLYLSWIMNFGAYGSMTVVSNQYIKLIVQQDIGFGSPTSLSSSSPSSFWLSSFSSQSDGSEGRASSRNELFLGAFLCVVYLAQMTMFLVGFISQKWMYHRWFIYIMELIGCVCLALISVVRHPVALLLIAFGCGLMAGTGYLSSYTYSFHSKGKSGKLVGLQETVLSMSSVILPPLAGLFVNTFDELRAPYWMCSVLVVLLFITQETTYHAFWYRWNKKLEQESVELTSIAPEH